MRGDPSTFDALLAEAVHEPPLLIAGTKLSGGRFVIRAVLGTGGMGAVYRAHDAHRRVEVAIKVLSRVDPGGIYRLKQEFRSLSNVRHPNLVALHEMYSDNGTWFLCMDLVIGTPLSRLRWTTSLVRHVFRQIAVAIEAIHREGKLHRDLKPSNVLLAPDGRVVVLDFGLVSDWAPGKAVPSLADDGPAGTPAYMAPEQATGHATPESDWYALGTMLYEALFGSVPFDVTKPGALARKSAMRVPAPPPIADEAPKELVDLCMRLLDPNAAGRPRYSELAAVLGSEGNVDTLDEPRQDPFVGRDLELQALQEALIETDHGRSALFAVSGSPGIGKTRLVNRFLDTVRSGQGVVLAGCCPKWEHIPFRACDSLIDDLTRYLGTISEDGAASVLPRPTDALAQVFPVLDRLAAVRRLKQHVTLPRDRAETRRLGLVALRDLLSRIAAKNRLVLFVDDMHWSDLDGARLLASLVTQASQPDAPPLLLVVAYRTQDAEHAPGLAMFLDRTTSNSDLRVTHLRLSELNATESQQLAAQMLGEPQRGVEERIAHASGGNPLFLKQLSRHALASNAFDGSLDLDGLLARRVAGLPPCERATLAAVCLTSRPVPLRQLGQIVDCEDPVPAARALEAAQLTRFVSGSGDAITAFHDRIREAVLSDLGAAERRRLHIRAIEALANAPNADLAALTLHYVGCGQPRDAAACAVRAAESAVSALAFEQAAAMYRLALDEGEWERPERLDLQVRLAEALVLDHRSGQAGDHFLRAATLEEDGARRKALRFRAADAFLSGGWFEEGIALLREILGEVGLDYDEISRADLVELRKRLGLRGFQIEPRRESEIVPETLARLDALVVAGNGLAWLKSESVQFRFALALEALDAGEPMRCAHALRTVARFDAHFDPDNDEVGVIIRKLREAHPEVKAELGLHDVDAGLAFVRGLPWDQCEAGRRNEEQLLRHPSSPARALAVARFHQGLGFYLQGELHDLDRCWGWLEDAEDRNDRFLSSWLNALLASRVLARGRPDTAREMCRKAARQSVALDDSGPTLLSLFCELVLGACDVYDGDDSAYDRVKAATRWFESSPISRHPFIACHCHGEWARLALACAKLGRPRREQLLLDAEASIELAAHPRGLGGRTFVLPHYRNLATVLGAGLAAIRGDTETALARLELGLAQLAATGRYSLLSAYGRRAKGALLGGAADAALVARAEADVRRLGVNDPPRHARTLLPGFAC